MITPTSKDALKAQADIVDVISSHIELKKAGANYKANCPFHEEKSASFVVSPAKQICHCFGCGITYDVFGFVQEYKHLSFTEAVEDVANEYNFTLQYDNRENFKDYSKLMEFMNDYYMSKLEHPERGYLTARGINKKSIKKFEIGYAPTSSAQIGTLTRELFDIQDAIECGICAVDSENNSKTYARLTKRISFPIRNSAGKLIGFGGRSLDKEARAKYINSPQTKLFDKSRNFYGFHLAKKAIHDKGTFTIVEGYLDVVMMHQAGIHTAVATMGTALTEQHATIIKKAGARALLCFDGDKAGISSALKASRLLSAHGIFGGVVIFPDGKDPADMVKAEQVEELMRLMKHSTPLIKFVLQKIVENYNLNSPEQKQSALSEVNSYLSTLSPLIQDEYKSMVSKMLGIDKKHIVQVQQRQQEPQANAVRQRINIAELNILNSATQDDERRGMVLNEMSEAMFQTHAKEFTLLKENELQLLQGSLLHDGLSIYSKEELEAQIAIIKITHLEKEMHSIIHSNDTFDRKSFEIKRIKGIVFELKKKIKKTS